MQVRFLTSVGTATGAYIEGQTVTLRDPLPEPFLSWLRRGIVAPVRDLEPETTLAPHEVEQAIARRRPARTRTRKGRATVPTTDGDP